ncbi:MULTISPECIES: hypothetical protein [Latilactobacillus]|uniref:hypothetical protein n=1 Tax=Latilactobacillus TaxID=2767885 RepID=UPI0021A886F1|nr:hypothetical protein [Latilactobacillus curvatus]MCT3358433.1 hypothetical protein [Latilactobacillus curvatus]
MTVEGILQFLGLVAFEIVVAILFNAFSTMQKRKLPYLICAISPLAAMMMFHSRYIGNDSLNYYNLFLQTSMSATVVKCWKIPIRKCRFSNIFLR